MSDSHTRREIESIRQQMNHVRGRMPYAMDIARAEAKQYLSWKYYVSRYPLSAAAIAAAVAYWAIPERKRPQPSRRGWRGRRGRDADGDTAEVASKASVIGVATSLLTNIALRGAANYFSGHLQNYLSQQAAARKAAKREASQRERSAT